MGISEFVIGVLHKIIVLKQILTLLLRSRCVLHHSVPLKSILKFPYGNHGAIVCKRPNHQDIISNSSGDDIMLNIARFSPFDDAFDHLLRGIAVRPAALAPSDTAARFRADIIESDKAYTVRAELPGVKKDDIQISIDGDQLAISAETRAEKEVKEGERVLRTERYSGKYYRAFALDVAVDEDAVAARYADGVLELTLPKKAVAAARRITIQ
jgi:HSP20 family protein